MNNTSIKNFETKLKEEKLRIKKLYEERKKKIKINDQLLFTKAMFGANRKTLYKNFNYIDHLINNENEYYEIITNACIPVFDIEEYHYKKPNENYISNLIHGFISTFKNLYGENMTFYIFNSSRKDKNNKNEKSYKISLHILIRDWYYFQSLEHFYNYIQQTHKEILNYPNNYEIKEREKTLKEFHKPDNKKYKKIIDTSIYKQENKQQLFRLPYSKKNNIKKSELKLITIDNIFNDIEEYENDEIPKEINKKLFCISYINNTENFKYVKTEKEKKEEKKKILNNNIKYQDRKEYNEGLTKDKIINCLNFISNNEELNDYQKWFNYILIPYVNSMMIINDEENEQDYKNALFLWCNDDKNDETEKHFNYIKNKFDYDQQNNNCIRCFASLLWYLKEYQPSNYKEYRKLYPMYPNYDIRDCEYYLRDLQKELKTNKQIFKSRFDLIQYIKKKIRRVAVFSTQFDEFIIKNSFDNPFINKSKIHNANFNPVFKYEYGKDENKICRIKLNELIQEEDIIENYSQIQLLPSDKEYIFSLWRGFGVDALNNDQEINYDKIDFLLNDYIFKVLANERKDVFNYIMDWLANLFQNVEDKQTALLFKSDYGTGKGVFNELCRRLMGKWLCYDLNKLSDLTRNFNSDLVNKKLIFVSELKELGKDNRTCFSTLKSLITDKEQMTEAKFKDRENIKSFSCYILNSNYHIPFTIIKSDRRFNIFSCGDHYKQNNIYYKNLLDNYINNDDVIQHLLTFLLRRKIKNNIHKPLNTKERNEIVDMSKPVEYEFLEQLKNDDHIPSHPLFKIKHIYKLYIEYCDDVGHNKFKLQRKNFKALYLTKYLTTKKKHNTIYYDISTLKPY